MPKQRIAPLALTLAIATGAHAASLTPPNLVAASSLNNPDLLLVWPYASGGPLEAMSWSTFKTQMSSGLAGSFLAPSNNLSDLGNPTIARTNLGLTLGTSGANLCLLNSACTWSALQSFAASNSGGASINLAPGVAPTSPNNGDLWATSTGLFARINGSTATVLLSFDNLATLSSPTTARVNLGLNVNGAVKVTTAGAASQAACADLSNGGNGGCSAKVVTGSLTPTLVFDTPGSSSFAYTTQEGSYVCVAGMVSGWIHIVFTPTNGSASGNLEWNNPPYDSSEFYSANPSTPLSGPVNFIGSWSTLSNYPYFLNKWAFSKFAFFYINGTSATEITTSNLTSGSSHAMAVTFNYAVTSC